MAIAPVQLPAQQANPLQGIIQGGKSITDILDQAIQLGRDRANNQFRADQQLTQNLQLAQGMSQRAAQDLDQRMIDRRNFNYKTEQDDIQLGLRREQMDMTRDQQLFNQGISEDRLNLARNADNRADTSLELRQQQLEQDKQFYRDIANPTAEETRVPPEITADGNVVSPVEKTYADALNQKEQAEAGVAAATKIRDAGALRTNQRRLAEAEAALKAIPKPPTEAEARAAEDQEFQRADRTTRASESRFKTMVEGDTSAFVPQQTFLNDKSTEEQRALASAYDKNAYSSELESARNADEEAYVKNIPNPTPAAIKKRRKFWQFANAQGETTTTTPTDNSLKARLDRLKQPR